MNAVVAKAAKRIRDKDEKATLHEQAATRILEGANPVQRALILDQAKKIGVRCPRRAGKSFGLCSKVLHYGELHPGSRLLIVSLTLKSTRENYFSGAPGGVFAQNALYKLGLEFNQADVVWYHQNGSRGRLAGAETRADIEYLRGAAAEADIIVIDEAKSFSPRLLDELVRDIIEPGLLTREGTLVMGGTPGSVPFGPFYEATQLGQFYDTDKKRPTALDYRKHPGGDSLVWSLHSWSMKDNEAKEHQWAAALRNKEARGITDNNPLWRREYLGEWVTDVTELVYHGFTKNREKCIWTPEQTPLNPTGLPPELGPWRAVMGLDFGYEDDCAIVMAAYSETVKEFRQFYNFKSPHLTVDDFEQEIWYAINRFGYPEVTVGDAGALGKTIVETLNSRGLGIVAAEKREKYDYIELINSDFDSGKVKIIERSDLDDEMSILQWDLSKDKSRDHRMLVRTGKLREDPGCANHLCDAMLYAWRYSNHYWAEPANLVVEYGTPEWYQAQENAKLAEIRKEKRLENKNMSLLREKDRQKWWNSL